MRRFGSVDEPKNTDQESDADLAACSLAKGINGLAAFAYLFLPQSVTGLRGVRNVAVWQSLTS
jgi:hypothetical protein